MKIDKTRLRNALHDPAAIRRLHTAHKATLKAKEMTTAEKNIADWLGQLKLLHGVPFHFLVPHADMLPPESIRFFYCNTIWLDYLQEGALSIGRSTSGLKAHDECFADDLKGLGVAGAGNQRQKVYGHLINHTHKKLQSQLMNTTPIPGSEKITGFILRSGVVNGWRGLQVDAFLNDDEDESKKQPSRLLRMDHLSSDVLLCMFEGVIKSVRIHEEPEVLHFGVDDSSGEFTKSFRSPDNIKTYQPGDQIAEITSLKMSDYYRPQDGATGVLRIHRLATDMAEKLKTFGFQDRFTSAEFALEMVEGVQAVDFTIS